MRAEQMIMTYPAMKKELEVLAFEIEQFKGIDEDDMIEAMVFRQHHDLDRVQTSGTSDRTFSTAINYKKAVDRENKERLKFLMDRYWYVREELEFFERCVLLLPEELKNLMTGFLFEGKTWDAMEAEMHISRRTVGNYRNRAVRALNESYRMRDDTECAYMCS